MNTEILVENNLIVCDKYGIGKVKSLYNGTFKGEDILFVHIYFDNIEMDYRGPVQNLKYREINKPSTIKKLFKDDISNKIRELISLNFNVQQSKMSTMMEQGSLEDVVFLLRYLYCKKENSAMNSLCAYDDTLYKKCFNNLSEELSVGSEKSIAECNNELKKLLQKYNVPIKIEVEPSYDIDSDLDKLNDEDFDM